MAAVFARNLLNIPRECPAGTDCSDISVNRALYAFHQVTHLFERDIGLRLVDIGGNDFFALVVFDGAVVDDHRAVHELSLGRLGLGFGGLGDCRAVGRHLDEAVFEAPAHEVDERLAFANRVT